MELISPTFAFRADLDPLLMNHAVLSRNATASMIPVPPLPNCACLTNFWRNIAARYGVYTDKRSKQHEVLKELK